MAELVSKTAKVMFALLPEIDKLKKKTVIVTTHDQNVVEMADMIYTI